MAQKAEATIEDLDHASEDGKAEIVDGELVMMGPTGGLVAYASGEILVSLREYGRGTGGGYAFPDNVGYIVELPRRRSFSPDASFYTGKISGLKFLEGAPVFAVEVRSEGDYGPKAEGRTAKKRSDYFAAGTLVVWDVDLQSFDVVKVYRTADPEKAQSIAGGRWPKQRQPCQAGECRLMIFSLNPSSLARFA